MPVARLRGRVAGESMTSSRDTPFALAPFFVCLRYAEPCRETRISSCAFRRLPTRIARPALFAIRILANRSRAAFFHAPR